ncbi:MAG: methyl-accepting chemotaxis protein [Xenococcaceae cyanobacterium MO_207.B15]|nr:methyl-accepting chemotaxis protein [Xenococcaceae cyanobacterium MO_207.B15]
MNQKDKLVIEHSKTPSNTDFIGHKKAHKYVNFTKNISLKTKVTLMAIALGALPTMFTGFIAYQIADKAITKKVYEVQQNDTKAMLDEVQRFLKEGSQDIKIVANLSILQDAKLRNTTTNQQKSLELSNFAQNKIFYDSINFIDLEGNDLAVSDGTTPRNHSNDDYFQSVIQTGQPFISQPRFSKSVGEIVIYFAAPVKDSVTNKLVGVVRSRMSIQQLEKVVQKFNLKDDSTYHIADRDGIVFLTNDREGVNRPAQDHLPSFAELRQARTIKTLEFYEPLEKRYVVGSYVPNQFETEFDQLGWDGFIVTQEAIAYSVQTNVGQAVIFSTVATTILVAVISIFTAQQLVQPIIKAASTVEKIGQGDLEQRLTIDNSDELATLSTNINQMAERIQQLIQEQETIAAEQMKAQIAIAKQEKQSKEAIEQELLQFISSIEEVSDGNLTVRANISDSSISIVADFFNSIIESLRDIVIQVKTTTTQVNSSIGENETAIGNVTQEALKQVAQITDTLNQVEQMTHSIQQVAQNAQEVARVSHSASVSATSGGKAIQQTVDSILQLRETVAVTTKKVKRLGESSQEISKVVSLINQIAMQTNLLAINASIEASHAGEEGKGFAVVAEEVGELAARSAEATKEIEEIVENIQEETQEVVAAMEIGTAQVVEGTKLVENTKNSLERIVEVSQEIDLLLQSISSATTSQAETSQKVTKLMEQVVEVSQRTSDISQSVSNSLETTVKIAQELETSVNTFTV